MEYEIRSTALPTYYRSVPGAAKRQLNVSACCPLGSEPITALHYHNMLEIGVCASGEGYTYIDDRVYKHKAGCISISRAYQPHLSTNLKDTHGEWSWISIDIQSLLTSVGMTDPKSALKLMRAAGSVTGVFLPDEIKTVKDAVIRLLNTSNRADEYTELAQRVAATEVLLAIATLPEEMRDKDNDEKRNTGYNAILPAIEYISSHLDESDALSEPALAALCKMSVSNLRRLFNLSAGLSPKAFILRSRMAYAEYLLRRSDMTVLDIALRVGYGDISGFNRVFRKHFGISPGKYRGSRS